MGADKGWPERTIGQQKEVEITAHFRMQSDECLGEGGGCWPRHLSWAFRKRAKNRTISIRPRVLDFSYTW